MLIQTSEGHLAAQFSHVCTFRRDASEYTLFFFFHKTFFIGIPIPQRRTVYFALFLVS